MTLWMIKPMTLALAQLGAGLVLAAALASSPAAYAQGGLNPTNAPAPTMKTLQELWEKMGVLQAEHAAQQAKLDELQLTVAASSSANLPWLVTTVDGGTNMVGEYTSLAFGPDGHPAISYLVASPVYDLNLARFNGSTWTSVTVDSAFFPGFYSSLAFGPDGHPAISHYELQAADLKFARFNGTVWSNTIVDSAGSVGLYTSLAFGPDGQPAIAYYDDTSKRLKIARFNGTAWTITTVDSAGGSVCSHRWRSAPTVSPPFPITTTPTST